MMVIYDKVHRGWVDSAFDGIDEYWVINAVTKELVFQAFGAGDVRSFRKEELFFTGEWSRTVESEAVVQIPPEVVDIIVETEDWESTWEEKTKVLLQIEHLVSGAPGRILIGPGFPPDVKAAEQMLGEHVRELIRSQDVTETLDVPPDLLDVIQAEENWETEWEEQADVRVRLEVLENGLGRITVGPGSGSVVTKAVALITLHFQELSESQERQGLEEEPGEITSEDIQKQLDKLKAEQEEEEARATAEAEAARAQEAMQEESNLEVVAVDDWGNESSELDARTPPAPKASVPLVVPARRPTLVQVAYSKASSPPPPASKATSKSRAAELATAQSKASPASLKDRLVAVSSISQASAVVQAARAKLARLDAGEAELEPEAPAPEPEGLEVEPEAAGKAEAAADAEPTASAEPTTGAASGATAEGTAEWAPGAPDEGEGTAAAAQAPAPAEGGAVEAEAAETGAAEAAHAGDGAKATAEAPAGQSSGDGAGSAAAAGESSGGGAGSAAAAGESSGGGAGSAAAVGESFGDGAGSADAAGGGEEGHTIEYWMQNQAQFAHLTPLPPSWIRAKSKSMGYIYYINLHDGTTTLQEPGQERPALPPGWTEVTSRSTGQVYYWHSATGHSQFVRPVA